MKPISVIILNWNGTKLLHKYLPSVVKYTNQEIADIIVADNGSTDDSIAMLKKEFPSVKIIELYKNYGFATGYNHAISRIDTEYFVLLNDDVRVTENWLEPLYEYMEANHNVAAIQPKILSDRDPKMFEYAGAAGGFIDKNGYPYCHGRIFDKIEEDKAQYETTKKIMWTSGACMMVRQDYFYKCGSFDEYFFAHMEEIDLCWRFRIHGYDVVYLPSSKVYHFGGASLSASSPLKTKLNFRNSIVMLYKNLPVNERGLICKRKWLDALAACNFLIHFKFGHFVAVWKAHREAKWMIKEIFSYRTDFPKENCNKLFAENKANILLKKVIG